MHAVDDQSAGTMIGRFVFEEARGQRQRAPIVQEAEPAASGVFSCRVVFLPTAY